MFSVLAKAQTNAETAGIEKACLDYVEGFYTSDTVRVARAVHPELAKRIVMRKFQDRLNNMTAAKLVAAAADFKHPDDPNAAEPFKAKVVIYDIDKDVATVKVTTNKMKFFDYAQLAKVKGEWKIINVLWAWL